MFCFLIDNVFLNFWGNSLGDIFVDATIKGIRLDKTKLRVIYFPELVKPDYFSIELDNTLIVKEKVESLDEEGNIVITYNDIETIQGNLCYENGLMFINC